MYSIDPSIFLEFEWIASGGIQEKSENLSLLCIRQIFVRMIKNKLYNRKIFQIFLPPPGALDPPLNW